MTKVRIRKEGTRVLVLDESGKAILDLPHDAALEIARALTAKARQAEEIVAADRIAFDQAVLLRAGARIGLTDHPDIQAEAAKLAAWDSTIRRAMPGGVRSQESFGTPTLIRHSPRRRRANG